jgi:transposase
LSLTAGQSHDGHAADGLLDHVGAGTIVLAYKAYDADRIRASLRERGAFANIPPKSNRRSKPYFSTWLYRERNLIERFFSKLKHFRRIATRYDKLAENFLAMVQLASMWLRVYESSCDCGCFARTSVAAHTSGCRILKEGSSHEALCRIGPVDGIHAGLHR